MIDSSMMSTYARCPRLHYYKYVKQIKKSTVDEGEMTRNFGQCIHSGLEIWQKEGSIEKGVEYFRSNYTNLEGENIRTVDNGTTLLRNYVSWEEKNFPGAKTLGVELLDKFNIGDIEYTVKIDRVMEINDNIYACDYKTTTSTWYNYFAQFSPNFAVSAYCSYVKKKFGKCSGFIPLKLEMGYLSKGAYVKDDDTRCFSNVSEKYHMRFKKTMPFAEGFWYRFDYDIVNRNSEQLDYFEKQVKEWYRRMYQYSDVDKFPCNYGACADFKGCEYRELCISCDDETIMDSLYKKVNAFEYLETSKLETNKEVVNEHNQD